MSYHNADPLTWREGGAFGEWSAEPYHDAIDDAIAIAMNGGGGGGGITYSGPYTDEVDPTRRYMLGSNGTRTYLPASSSGGGNTPTNPDVIATSGSPSGYTYVPTGQAVYWNGAPYNGAGYANGYKADTATTAKPGTWTGYGPKGQGTYYLDGPNGTPGTYIGPTQAASTAAAPRASSGGGGGGGSEPASVSTAMRIAADAAQQAADQAFKAAQSVEDKKFAVYMQEKADALQLMWHKTDYELQRAKSQIDYMAVQEKAAKDYGDLVSSPDPGAFAAFIAANGNLMAGLNANSAGALSTASLAPAAQALKVTQTPFSLPTWDAINGTVDWGGRDSGGTGAGGATTNPWDTTGVTGIGGAPQVEARGAATPPAPTGGMTESPVVGPPVFTPEFGDQVAPDKAFGADLTYMIAHPDLYSPGSVASNAYLAAGHPVQTYNAVDANGNAYYDAYKYVSSTLAAQPKVLLPGQSVAMDNGIGGGQIPALTKQATVPLLAGGGMEVSRGWNILGDAPGRKPDARGARPEATWIPPGTPFMVMPHDQTDVMLGREMQGMRRYADGTTYDRGAGGIDWNFWTPDSIAANVAKGFAQPVAQPQSSSEVSQASALQPATVPNNPWTQSQPGVPSSVPVAPPSVAAPPPAYLGPPTYVDQPKPVAPPSVAQGPGTPPTYLGPPAVGPAPVAGELDQVTLQNILQSPDVDLNALGLTQAQLQQVLNARLAARTGYNPADMFRFNWGQLDPVTQATRAMSYQKGWNIPTAYTAWAPGAYTPSGMNRNRMTVAA